MSCVVCLILGQVAWLQVTMPSIASEWPTMYLVAAWMDTSTPCSKGLKNSGVPQVLSITTTAPCACAIAAIAGMSWISRVSEPGDSTYTTLVLGRMNAAMDWPQPGS